ncbi:hypothetical protein [Rhizobium rhizophilum]|uniref:DUF1206 domain-containing protein n=1 Tax=Rhizobium rhizophilum TaxID=1850373 RepID=A0ABY2R187_9HYPH|nr:hypothetical protein [Rhizobium rhizophilum]THV17402.1 hypothetical protein E9677_05320 [Rhizobium rhizophilum]
MTIPFKRMSLMERSALTFQSYLNGDFGRRFYTDEFLSGICKTRYEIHMAVGKAAGFLGASSLALAYFDLLPQKLTIFSNQIAVSQSMVPILNVFAAAAFLNFVMKFIEGLLIDRYISRIGQNIDIYSFDLFLLDKSPVNIWVDPLTPRYFGDRSGLAHKGVLPALGLLMAILYIGIAILIVALIVGTAAKVILGDASELSAKLISAAAIMLIALSILIVMAFSVKFKFHDARFDEYTLEPTKAFKKELEGEMGAQPVDAESANNA